MARIAGIDIPRNKRGVNFTHVHLRNRTKSFSLKFSRNAGVDSEDKKVEEWTDEEIGAVRNSITSSGFKVEGELRSESAV